MVFLSNIYIPVLGKSPSESSSILIIAYIVPSYFQLSALLLVLSKRGRFHVSFLDLLTLRPSPLHFWMSVVELCFLNICDKGLSLNLLTDWKQAADRLVLVCVPIVEVCWHAGILFLFHAILEICLMTAVSNAIHIHHARLETLMKLTTLYLCRMHTPLSSLRFSSVPREKILSS